jgi:alkylhydroperoxidase family enzyme
MSSDRSSSSQPALLDRLSAAVFTGPGSTATSLRQAVKRFVEARTLGGAAEPPGPASLAPFLEKLALHAFRLTDEDVAALRADRLDEDALFELTVAGATAAGLLRLERGLAAIPKEG